MRTERSLLLSWVAVVATAGAFIAAIVFVHMERPGGESLTLVEAKLNEVNDPIPPPPAGIAVELPDDWTSRERELSVAWYQVPLELKVAPNRLWALYIPSVEMTPAVFINGNLIGGTTATDPLPRYWNRPVYYSVPNGLLTPGDNRIDIRVAANGRWGRISEIYLGPDADLIRHFERRHFLRVTVLNITMIVGLIVSTFIGAIYLVRHESIYGWFSLFALAWGLQNFFILAVEIPVANALWDMIGYILFGFMVVTGSVFSLRFLELRQPFWERGLIGTAIAGPIILGLILWFADFQSYSAAASFGWFSLLLALTSYPFALMLRATLTLRNVEVVALVACYSIIISLAAHDWAVATGIGYRHNGHLMQFSAAPTFLTFGVILMRRFILALRETDTLNRNLERRIEEKSAEIEQSYARSRELEAQRVLMSERERIMRDMHDGVGSQLIGTLARLDDNDVHDHEIADELRGALDDLRLMIDSLDSVNNELVVGLGLFRNRIQPQLDAAGLQLHWQIEDVPPVDELGPHRLLHFLRMMQEAVTNVIKHANAKNLVIRTRPTAVIEGVSCIAVEIEDDGVGFEDSTVNGRGLKNLHYRASEARLKLNIDHLTSGTLVSIGFPSSAPSQ